MIYKALNRKLKLTNTNPTSSVGELRYSCSNSCTNFDSLARILVVSHDSRMEIITHANIVVLEIFKTILYASGTGTAYPSGAPEFTPGF